MSLVAAVQVSVAFVWLGMVLAISFVEAPLKFRAPGVTIPIGVGIGRLVFRALNSVEAVFGLALIVTLLLPTAAQSWWSAALVVAACLILAAGAGIVRPAMDRRVRQGEIADGVPRTSLHLWYVLLELLKVFALIGIGVSVFAASA